MIAMRLMPDRQCVSCTRQKEWGCHARKYVDDEGKEKWDRPARMALTVDGEADYACPRQTLRENPQAWNTVLTYYGLYKRGLLPDEGAVSMQSNRIMQVFGILDDANNQCDREIAEKERQRNARDARAREQRGKKGLR